ncbi:mariner Mos1 transposase [Trichonephila clavipes]|nr:mariner Mos1 transposase [Trichonephila clavipes]
MEDFRPKGTIISSGAYCTSLRQLRRTLQNKRCGMLSKSIFLLHHDAMVHTSRATRDLIESFGWEVFDHAPYRPDLAPTDFQYLKHNLGGKHFSDYKEVKATMNSWLSNQAADFFEMGFKT